MILSAIDLCALALVALIGLPHGAFDGAVYALLPDRGAKKRRLSLFLISYTMLALAIIFLWLVVPLASLVGFLAISAFHFGKGDTEGYHGKARLVAIVAHGGLVTIFLPLMHQAEAFAAFAALTFRPSHELEILSFLLWLSAFAWGTACLIYGWMSAMNAFYRARFIELILLCLILAYLPILAGFALYFCFIHSRRHFVVLYQSTKSQAPRSLLPLAIGLSCASWMAGALGLILLNQYQSFAVSIIQIIFIGLAALTVPHMILVDGLWRPLAKPTFFAR